MSLINEALRKARQAASEHEAKQAEEVFRPRKAYPSRRSGGGGWLVTLSIAVTAAVVGASAAWWFFGERQPTATESTIAETRQPGIELPVTTPVPSPTAVDETTADTAETTAVEVPTPQPPLVTDDSPDRRSDADETVAEPTPSETVGTETVPPSGERVFVMEAEIGEVVLSLGFIVARINNPFAEINGIEVSVGSEIEGFVVEAIEADRVVLRDDAGPLILRVP